MAQFPYLPLWTDAYLADTTHLRTEEHGAYLLLLFSAWRTPDCSLPNDDGILARIAGVSPSRWLAMKATILAFWKLDKRRKRWVQKRLKEEREKVAEKKGKARDSAARRWKDKKKGNANAMRTQCYPEPEPDPFGKPIGFPQRVRAKKQSGFVKPRTAADAAMAFIERRRFSNEPTGTAADGEGACIDVPLLSAIGSR